jgi:DNA repair exonuclease SbcCD ATPase subunit
MIPRRVLAAPILIASVLIAGCGTPQSVKSLSSAQVETMIAFKADLQKYFSTMETLVGNQIEGANADLDKLTNDIVALRRKQAASSMGKSANITADSPALVSLTDSVAAQLQQTMKFKEELRQRKASLEAAHKRFLASYDALVLAQQKLNEYLQLEKADEKAFNELLGAIGIKRTEFDAAVSSVEGIVKGIDDTMKRVKQLRDTFSG